MAIYEEVLRRRATGADVLATVSGDLGVTGHAREIIELIAPRYDAQRHGPAAGINLLQAYLAVRDPESAQHVLDLLFALDRPELQDRLLGFSNVIADMMLLAGEEAVGAGAGAGRRGRRESHRPREHQQADLVLRTRGRSRSAAAQGGPAAPGGVRPARRARAPRIGSPCQDQPEDELGRLSRGIPLWLAEMLVFSTNYPAIAAVATRAPGALRSSSAANGRPNTSASSSIRPRAALDYVFTGALRQLHGDYELVLRLWEVKKFRERKAFTARWTPATADQALGQLQAQLRTFMEFTPYPAGRAVPYAPPARLRDYVEALGAGLTLFLGEKNVLPAPQVQSCRTRWPPARVPPLADGRKSPRCCCSACGRARRAGIGLCRPPAELPPVAQRRTRGRSDDAEALGALRTGADRRRLIPHVPPPRRRPAHPRDPAAGRPGGAGRRAAARRCGRRRSWPRAAGASRTSSSAATTGCSWSRALLDPRSGGGPRLRGAPRRRRGGARAATPVRVMRVYFEKPRTVVGWKGLINDPGLDDSFEINRGLRLARRPAARPRGAAAAGRAPSFSTPRWASTTRTSSAGRASARARSRARSIASWRRACPCRSASRTGRDGDVQIAVDAIRAARHPHWFPSLTKDGTPAVLGTTGNECGHLVLRGGPRGPNFAAADVQRRGGSAARRPACPPQLMVDCSHGNSGKDAARQPAVAADLAGRRSRRATARSAASCSRATCVAGAQDYRARPLVYGRSVTDPACRSRTRCRCSRAWRRRCARGGRGR